MNEPTVLSMLELGLDALDGLPVPRRRALVVIAGIIVAAEDRGDRELARELCEILVREAHVVVDARNAGRGKT